MGRAVPVTLAVGMLFGCDPRLAQTALDPGSSGGSTTLGGTPGNGGDGSGGAGAAPTGGTSGEGSGGAGAATVGGNGASGGAPDCPDSLQARLTQVDIAGLNEDIRYKLAGYGNLLRDDRLALSVAPNGDVKVAWLNDDLNKVHVTSLDDNLVMSSDVVVPGHDLGGLVAHDDGFALLTRRTDPGEQLTNNEGKVERAAMLVRYRGDTEVFAAALTGTEQVNKALAPNFKRDCAPRPFQSRLVFDGTKYGAFFPTLGCSGFGIADKGTWPDATFYGDKLIYVDDAGRFDSGGDAQCPRNEGVRLLAGAGGFLGLCLGDRGTTKGINLVVDGSAPVLLSPEYAESGFSTARFGSVVPLSDGGYFVGWLTRGGAMSTTAPPDPMFVRLGPDRAMIGTPRRIFTTPDIYEANLHFAPYGPNLLLMVWDSVTQPRCLVGSCTGDYQTTYMQLITKDGEPLSQPERAEISAPPNGDDDIVVFPNSGDLGWVFVSEGKNRNYRGTYAHPISLENPPAPTANSPAIETKDYFSVARLRYCEP